MPKEFVKVKRVSLGDPSFRDENEHGVVCACNSYIFFEDKDLTPPNTYVKCPICGHEITYISGRYKHD